MSEGMDNDGSGGTTPTSPNFDPGASEFVPHRTPATDSRTASGQLRAAFNTISGPVSSGRKAVRPGLPLFASDTWSPTAERPIRSAGLAPKASWESFTGRTAAVNGAQPQASPGHRFNGGTPNHFTNSPLSGRGQTGGFNTDGRAFDENMSPGFSNIRYTQTAEYHSPGPKPSPKGASHSSFAPRTAPLPQGPFGTGGYTGQNSSSGGSNASQQVPVPGTPHSSASSFETQAFDEHNSEDDLMSPASGSIAISDHYSKTHPEQTGAKGEVWTERQHPRSLRRALKDSSAEWEEAYPGALTILTCMNPEAYQMPYGTRVVNIKTEYPRNVLLSLKYYKWAVIEKVAERIMKVWDSRANASEKVLFLFSVNGSKRFCGVAEMSGPWDRNDSIPNWEHNPDSSPCVGTIPCIWLFVKDVNYHQFIHIRQRNNDNQVGNMWNGMNFASETGREVMEAYVKSPATASILGHPRNYAENAGLPPASVHNRRGAYNSRGPRGGRGDFRGGARGGHASSQPWRQRNLPSQATEGGFDADLTPTADTLAGQRYPVATDGPPPKFNSPTCEAGPRSPIKPGQLLSVIVNDQGKLEVIGIDAPSQDHAGSLAPTEGGRSSTRGGRGGFRGALHGARSLGNLHQSSSSTSTVQPGTHRLHPAASMESIGRGQSQAASWRGQISPLSATWNNMNGGSHDALRSPEGAFGGNIGSNGVFGGMSGIGQDTPTHRPGSRRAESVAAKGLQVARPSMNLLKARFHSVAAEQYSMQAQLDQPDISEMNSRLLNAKIARILVEKREIQAELGVMGVYPETLSPMHRNSFSSTEPESASSASVHQISPVRAEDGRRLRSVSKLDSPNTNQDSSNFDKAPGGSLRRKNHKPNESWDQQIKKSISDLVDSPKKKASTPAHSATSTSAFFPDNVLSPCERRALSFPTPRGVDDKQVTSPTNRQNSSFPVGSINGSDNASSTGGQDDAAPPRIGGVRLDS